MDQFELIWEELVAALQPGIEIKHWNPNNSYLKEKSTVIASGAEFISIDPPRVWGAQQIPKYAFQSLK